MAEVQKNVNLNFVAVIKRAPNTTSKMHIKKLAVKKWEKKILCLVLESTHLICTKNQ